MRRPWHWALIALAILLLVGTWLIFFLDANHYKSFVSSWLSARVGRTITITGDLKLDPGLTIGIDANDVRIANAKWAEAPDMARFKRVRAQLELWPWLLGRTVLRELTVEQFEVSLQRNATGDSNWEFKRGESAGGGVVPVVERLRVSHGAFSFHDARGDVRASAKLDRLTGGASSNQAVHLDGGGEYANESFRFTLDAGPFTTPTYPLKAEVSLGETRILLQRASSAPGMKLEATGPNLTALNKIPYVALPSTAPFRVTGTLVRTERYWEFSDFFTVIGESDLSGKLRWADDENAPLLSGELTTEYLDLNPFFGTAPAPAKSGVLPTSNLRFHSGPLKRMAVQISLTAKRLRSRDWRLGPVTANIKLHEGELTIQPVSIHVAGGKVFGSIQVDEREATPKATVHLDLAQLRLDRILARSPLAGRIAGNMNGNINLRGVGDTSAVALGAAEGQVVFLLRDGELDRSLIDRLGMNIADILGIGNSKGKSRIRCAIVVFAVRDGIATAKPVVIDTMASMIMVEGTINLKNEALNLTLLSHPKRGGSLSARAPIHVTGPITSPTFKAERASLATTGAAALALGALLSPIAALLPLLEPGAAEHADCKQLLGEKG